MLHLCRSRVLSNGGAVERLRVSNYGLRPHRSAALDPLRRRLRRHLRGARHAARARAASACRRIDGDGGPCCAIAGSTASSAGRRVQLAAAAPDRGGREPCCFDAAARAARHGVEIEHRRSTLRGRRAAARRSRRFERRGGATQAARQRHRAVRAVQHRRARTRSSTAGCERSSADLQMMIDRHAARAAIRTPASPGSARRSAATASSPRSSCSGLRPTSRAACSRSSRRRRRRVDRRCQRRAARARSCTRCATGEMAALGEVPFGRYYGSVDATPLFVMLAARVLRAHRRPRASSSELWPQHRARRSSGSTTTATSTATASSSTRGAAETGLVQQGWKDSHDSVFHADGTLAEAPIALCEVQGYVYAAWRGAARAGGRARGDARAAEQLARRAAERCARASSGRSGARSSAPTRWRSTATSGRAACAPRTPATACSPASPRPNARARASPTR